MHDPCLHGVRTGETGVADTRFMVFRIGDGDSKWGEVADTRLRACGGGAELVRKGLIFHFNKASLV